MRAPNASGFVLVGVVMFVLALTILGLSLFALSGYEGEFLSDTHSEEQALFRAEGGMALAQALLSVPPYQLTQSHAAEDTESVVRATAWQDRGGGNLDSTGTLDWGSHVFLRVTTQVGSQTRVVEQEFSPEQHYSPYKRLVTARAIEYTERDASNRSRSNSTHLDGPREAIWQWVQAASDTSWLRDVRWDSGRPMLTIEAPTPNTADYFSLKYAAAVQAQYPDSGGGEHRIKFDALSDAATAYFRSPPKTKFVMDNVPAARCYDFYIAPELKLEVRGTCVWMAPTGIRFNNRVTFKRASGANQAPTLVIVTGPNGLDMNYGNYTDVGLWFFDQGIKVEDNVRVIIVSSGGVRLEVASAGGGGGGGGGGGFTHPGGGTDPPGGGGGGGSYDVSLPYLNIFADHLTMMGPRSTDGEMNLSYSTSMNSLIDDLISRGVLPTASGQAAGGFTPVAGTWRLP